jgi:outer membrane immunogenic protein
VGWTAGGGAEWMCGQNWSVKAEVLYVDLGSYTTTGTPPPDPRCRQGFSNTAVLGRAGVNLHF